MVAESIVHDLWLALRSAMRRPGTTAVLLVSLALGTGANAAVFGVMRRLVLAAPPGVEDSRQLVNIYTSEFSAATHGPSSYADYRSLASGTRAFASLAVMDDHAVENVRRGDRGAATRISRVSGAFFETLRLVPSQGRVLTADDETTGAAVAILSQPFAEQLGGGAIVGNIITIGEADYTVVGVTSGRFRGLQIGRESDVWVPLAHPSDRRGDRRLAIIGRLGKEHSIRTANAELEHISNDLASRYPATNRGNRDRTDAPRRFTSVRYSPLDPAAGDQVFVISVVVGGAAALLLASACLNVGSLLLSSAVARRGEFAIKMALGASRPRLVQQLLVEALVLSIAGGALGLLFAYWTSSAMPALFMVEQAEQLDTRLDATAFALTIGVAAVAGAIFGIAPAIHATSSPAATALRADAGNAMNSPGATRLRAWLVGSQVTLSTALLVGAGLAVSSLDEALQAGLGSTTKRVAFVSVELPGRFGDPLRGISFRNALVERLEAVPSVESVGWSSKLPIVRGGKQQFVIEGAADVTDAIDLDTNVVTPEYFRTLLLQLVDGRMFDDGDGWRATRVVIVDELLAQRYFGANAIGRHLVDNKGDRLRIIGIVRGGRFRTLQQAPQPTVFYPVSQEYLYLGHAIVRTTADPESILPALQDAVSQAGRGGAALEAETLDTYLGNALAIDRLITALIGVSGIIALAMSAVGIYGVMTDTVRRRTREIGLRVALGARHLQIAGVVFGESMRLAALGLLAGLSVALVGMAAARTLLFGVPMLDVITLDSVIAALVSVIALAAVLPLREALRVSPMIALRTE